jgi:hypothetical protein
LHAQPKGAPVVCAGMIVYDCWHISPANFNQVARTIRMAN